MRLVLGNYTRYQKEPLEKLASDILVDPLSVDPASIDLNNSFFVFNIDKLLIYSNRGKGKEIPQSDYMPIKRGGKTIGYFYAGDLKFSDNEANRIFMSSLVVLVIASVFISLIVGLVFAVFSAKRIAVPVSQLTGDIRKIQGLEEVRSRDFSISELSEISTALQQLSRILASNEEYKRQWMQDIAHDLRSPISGLKGQLEGLRDGVLEPSVERFDKNLAEIERLHRLVEAIADLYRMENVRDLDYSLLKAGDFVRDLLAPHEVALKEKKLNVDIEINAETISGQRDLLLRGIGNIVTNAVSYVEEGGRIGIEVHESEIGAVIKISDDGPGIDRDQIDKIFNRFYRGEFARKTPGTGLGLNIAKEIVNRHGGSIAIEDVLPKGVSFVISLPNQENNRP